MSHKDVRFFTVIVSYVRLIVLSLGVIPSLTLAAPQLDISIQADLLSIQVRETPLGQVITALGEQANVPVGGALDEKSAQQLVNFQMEAVALPSLLEELKRVAPFNYLLVPGAAKQHLWLLQTQKAPAATPAAAQPAANPNTQIPPPIIPPPR